jgi:hypothetical protein
VVAEGVLAKTKPLRVFGGELFAGATLSWSQKK